MPCEYSVTIIFWFEKQDICLFQAVEELSQAQARFAHPFTLTPTLTTRCVSGSSVSPQATLWYSTSSPLMSRAVQVAYMTMWRYIAFSLYNLTKQKGSISHVLNALHSRFMDFIAYHEKYIINVINRSPFLDKRWCYIQLSLDWPILWKPGSQYVAVHAETHVYSIQYWCFSQQPWFHCRVCICYGR